MRRAGKLKAWRQTTLRTGKLKDWRQTTLRAKKVKDWRETTLRAMKLKAWTQTTPRAGKLKDWRQTTLWAGKLKAWRQTILRAFLDLNALTCSHSVGLQFLDVVYFITVPVGYNWESHYSSGAVQLWSGDCCDQLSVKLFSETEI